MSSFPQRTELPQTVAANLDQIHQIISATLDPRVSNESRQAAYHQLNAYKSSDDAPHIGFAIAENVHMSDAARHFGLELLAFAIRYRWDGYDDHQTAQLRTWVKTLAGSIRPDDSTFIRSKTAQLWVEVAKRSWGDTWMDMDQLLCFLWFQEKSAESAKALSNKLLVLSILETLSEEINNNEDAIAGLRMETLGSALNEIMIPPDLYAQHKATRNSRQEVRAGGPTKAEQAGWIVRICEFFKDHAEDLLQQEHMRERCLTCAVKALNALKPTMSWVSLRAIEEAGCTDKLFSSLQINDAVLQTSAIEALYICLNRPFASHVQDIWMSLFRHAMAPNRLALLRQLFEDTSTGPGEDDEKYTLHKKIAELLSVLADGLVQRPNLADHREIDLRTFFELLLLVLQSKSLTVSIPVLHSWTKLTTLQESGIVDLVLNAYEPLLHVCSERLLRYEALLEQEEDDVIAFLNEDFEDMPSRHAFMGNYRRYCNNTIQQIARSRPMEALSYALNQMRTMLQTGPYTYQRGLSSSNYTKSSLPVLRFDISYSVVSSTLKGYSLWSDDVAALTNEDALYDKVQNDLQEASTALEQWTRSMLDIHIDDPGVAEQVLQTLVLVLKTLKSPSPGFVLQMVQHLLTMQMQDNPAHAEFSDGVKVFESLRVMELQKLAQSFPDTLLEVYNELEPRVLALAQQHGNDSKLVWGYNAFLFMVVHRAKGIDHQTRMDRLQNMLKPVYEAWSDPSLTAAVKDFPSFLHTLGMGNIASFYETHRFHRVMNWSAEQLDAAGQAKQNEIREKPDRIPLRMAKAMIAATAERLRGGTDEYEAGCALWGELIPIILPNLLQMLRHAQAFHNLANWSQLPDDLQMVVRRTLQDRFWQSGISNESKEQFFARISGSRTSYEGFASTVRGTMRTIRENCYHIIFLMTRFEEQFYGMPNLPDILASALFDDAASLHANHLQAIISLTKALVRSCPPHHRASFLPPIILKAFVNLDRKVSADWETLRLALDETRNEQDELGDEMRTESVLRQLTGSVVGFVSDLLGYENSKSTSASQSGGHRRIPDLLLGDPVLLEPMIMFCLHALSMRDTRSCSNICHLLKFTVPMFAHTHPVTTTSISVEVAAQVREFMCTQVLEACITSIHEPYFADAQKDLAALIAQILVSYSHLTDTAHRTLLALPDMDDLKVNAAIARVRQSKTERGQRSLVLELLENVRSASIHELYKIQREAKKKNKPVVHQQYLTTLSTGHQSQYSTLPLRGGGDGADESLDGVAGLFGQD